MDIQQIQLSQITRVYVGKNGCMCGCKGKYTASSHAKAPRTYDKVNDDVVMKVFRTIQANAKDPEYRVDGEDNKVVFSVVLNKKLYWATLED